MHDGKIYGAARSRLDNYRSSTIRTRADENEAVCYCVWGSTGNSVSVFFISGKGNRAAGHCPGLILVRCEIFRGCRCKRSAAARVAFQRGKCN